MARVYRNNYSETITTTTVSDTDTSFDVSAAPASLAAGDYYLMTLADSLSSPTKIEVVKVTGVSGVTLTVERAQDGTSAYAWASGDFIEIRATASSYQEWDGVTVTRYNEAIAASTNNIDRADGGIQTYTMTANTTFSIDMENGESLLLHLSGADTYIPTWPTMTWANAEPAYTSTDAITFWKVGGNLYGAYVGAI